MKRIKIILFLAISLAIFSCNDQATPVEDEQNEDQIYAFRYCTYCIYGHRFHKKGSWSAQHPVDHQ